MTINVLYQGIESTPAIAEYIDEKMSGLAKYDDQIEHIDAEVGRPSQHHQKGDIFCCKILIQVKGDVIRIEREAEDLYKAIDHTKDQARMELASRKERMREHRNRNEAQG